MAPPLVNDVLASPGAPLSAGLRGAAQQRFGRDFSQVRVHADAQADRSAKTVNASAYTVGSDIVFASGRYAPERASGRALLWHELTHVTQQADSWRTPHQPIPISGADAAERQAQRVGNEASRSPAPFRSAPAITVGQALQRQTPEDEGKIRGIDSDDQKIRQSLGLAPRTQTGVTWLGDRPEWFHGDQDTHVQWLGGGASPGLKSAVDTELHKPPAPTRRPTPPGAAKRAPGAEVGPGQAPAGAAPSRGAPPVSVPVTYSAIPVGGPAHGGTDGNPARGAPGLPGVAAGGGLGLHSLAFGDLSWLDSPLSAAYLGPLVPRSGVALDRALNVIPRDLTPPLATHLQGGAPGDPLTWTSQHGRPIEFAPDAASPATRAFTAEELLSIESLVRRYRANPASLGPAELQLLREAARVHIGGSTPTSPLTSFSRPGSQVAWANQRQYIVRVNVEKGAALDVSQKNAFNLGEEALTNVDEAEFLVVGDQSGRIVSVRRVGAPEGWAARNATPVRWGGRILLVAGAAYSGYRIAEASPEERPRVVGQEVGGQVGGYAGGLAATAGCIALGVATEGIGLFLCGLGGGIVGGVAGSAGGGSLVDAIQNAPAEAYQRSAEQRGDEFPPGSDRVVDDLLGPPVF